MEMIRLLALLVITGLGGAALAQDSQDAVLTEKTTHITDHVDAIMGFPNIGIVTASTPLTTFEVLPAPSGAAFYRIVQVSSFLPTLYIQLWPTNQVRLYWATAYPGFTLQSKLGLFGTWANAGLAVTVVGNEYQAFDTIGLVPKYYRLIK